MIHRANAQTVLRKPCEHRMYAGLDYNMASKAALILIQTAGETGNWQHLPSHLEELWFQMMKLAPSGEKAA